MLRPEHDFWDPGHSYQPLAPSWRAPGDQEPQTHAPETLCFARKNKNSEFCMKMMLVAAMHKYARRRGHSTIWELAYADIQSPAPKTLSFARKIHKVLMTSILHEMKLYGNMHGAEARARFL